MTDKQNKILKNYFSILEQNNEKLEDILEKHTEELDDILPLVDFILDRVDTVCSLVEEDRNWDAEIIFRSVIESFVKFLYISSASKNDRKKRLDEYCVDLGEIKQLRYSNLIKKLFPIIEPKIISEAFASLVLPKDEENKIKSKWTYEKRKEIEKKWSFSNLLKSIINDYHGMKLELFSVLFNNYMLSSSVTHADIMGLHLINEYNLYAESNNDSMKTAQKIRIISDCAIYCFFVAIEIAAHLEIDASFFVDNFNKTMSIRDETIKYIESAVNEMKQYQLEES